MMKPAISTATTTVPIRKNLLRARVRNSRRAIRSVVCGSGSRKAALRHGFSEDVEQAGQVAPELVHRPRREGGSEQGPIVGPPVELDQGAGAVSPHDRHASQVAGPTVLSGGGGGPPSPRPPPPPPPPRPPAPRPPPP